MKKLPHYILEIDDTDELGIVETSFVEYPATGLGVYLFSKEDEIDQPKLKTFSKDGFERMTSGVLMMPDTKYLKRTSEGDLYTVEFKAETLQKALIKYIKAGYEDTVKLEHSIDLWDKKFVAIEHWIIEDENTKSPIFGHTLADLGYNPKQIPAGTIMKTTYVEDEEFWNEFILGGKVNGYSLGGLFEMKEVVVTEEEFKAPEINSLLNDLGIGGDNIVLTTEDGSKLKFGAIITNTEDEKVTGEYSIAGKSFRVVEGVLVDTKEEKFSEEVPLTEVVDAPVVETPNTDVEQTSTENEVVTPEVEEEPTEPNTEENVTLSTENVENQQNSEDENATILETQSEDSKFTELLSRMEQFEQALKDKDTTINELKAANETMQKELEDKNKKNETLKNKLGKQLPNKQSKLRSLSNTSPVNTQQKQIRIGNKVINV